MGLLIAAAGALCIVVIMWDRGRTSS